MNKKVTSIFAYCGIVGWLIGFFAGAKEEAKFHLNQGLILAIADCIPVVCFVAYVFQIMGIIAAANDEEKELPLIGSWTILK